MAVDGDAILVLSADDYVERRDGCWRDLAKGLPGSETKTLAADETLAATYALVNHVKADVCWPTGDYRFSEEYTVDPETNGFEYEWWFVVSVRASDSSR